SNNLSQKAFAEIVGVHRGHISKIETGAANPSDNLLCLVCMEFDISWDWLNTGKGPMKAIWGPEDLRGLIIRGLVPHKQKSFLILYDAVIRQFDHLLKVINLLNIDISHLRDPNIKSGDPIIKEILEDALNKLNKLGRAKLRGEEDPGKLTDVEKSLLTILRTIDKNSLKDFYLFLSSKANRLQKKKRDKIRKHITTLRKASK
ncbi:MAG: helix-turn-helix domain-containing protein, partial [candidate division Zixibacteria bacterium]|nr:helix-turn-helix domain-containing protein [candidate division Zixibacteria bacterium]